MADKGIVSLSIGSQHVAGAVFSKAPGGGLRLDRFERTDFVGDPANDAGRVGQAQMGLKEIVSKLKLKGARTNYVVSSHPVLMKFANIPALDGEQVDQIVEFEAQQQVPYPINEVAWGFQLVEKPDDIDVDVILAAVKAEELDEIDELVSGAGIKSEGAEISPVALYNALRFNYSDIEGATLLIDIGARTTDLIFMEGGKVFIRTIKIGGSDITRALAKEFGVEYGEADQRKVTDGFVALGGPYADHEDPVIAGMSKVIRNSLTRLHSEVMRTTNFYRSQQGGSAPQLALLSGSTAGLPFIREFFAEKLNIPIDYFNALRNVTVAGSLDQEMIASNAHNMGDLVGSALNQIGTVPVQIDLIPASVEKERELDNRKPALILSVLAVAALLGALGFFFSRGADIANEKVDAVRAKAAELKKFDKSIAALKSEILVIDQRKEPFVDVVFHRGYWVRVFNYLGSKMQGDFLFVTVLEPLSGGAPVLDEADEEGSADVLDSVVAPTEKVINIDAFSIEGLWRENPIGGEVVYKYFGAMKKDAVAGKALAFDLKDVDISEISTVDSGTKGTSYSYPWKMTLPLLKENQVKFTK